MSLSEFQIIEKLEKDKQNALNEVRILASIQHPHIIAYKEAFIDDATSCLCLITECADNGDLFQKIQSHSKSNTQIHEGEAWKFFIQLVFGLKKLHDLKVFHRDLKSANVFLFKDGKVKLGDMNVSKVAQQGLLFTQTGTPYYASPEVWRDQPYDSKSDIWSLGCVLYEMLAMRPPFKGNDMEHLYKNIMTGKYPSLPNIYSSDISSVIKSMLQVNSKVRPSCLTILTMDIVKKRIDKYFDPDYLIEERQTYQGITKIENTKESNGVNKKNILLRTIRLTDNIFQLKGKFPEPAYDGQFRPQQKQYSPILSQRSVEEKGRGLQENDVQKKIETIIPLSYITPIASKHISSVPVSQPTQMIDDFLLSQDDQTNKKRTMKLESKKYLEVQKDIKHSEDKKSIHQQMSENKEKSIINSQKAKNLDTSKDLSSYMKRDLSVQILQNRLEMLQNSINQYDQIKPSASQKVILPMIRNNPNVDTSSIQDNSMKIYKSHKFTKNNLLIDINNNQAKNELLMKGKYMFMKDLSTKNAQNKRYIRPLENSPSNQRLNNEQMFLPQLKGVSLESYKQMSHNDNPILDSQQLHIVKPLQSSINKNHLKIQIKAQSSENQKKVRNILDEKKERLKSSKLYNNQSGNSNDDDNVNNITRL